ncbi:hypothetical protein PSHT_08217 [Puccinia striiformis]|uniref:Uncharacterized protein n=1 Tax=Puccinia striiformis TaxID=27350 RepID=A0A2S4VRC0_9BASI|nr:hypothetical protein PSHT_08217 [Puccinia striiformis]
MSGHVYHRFKSQKEFQRIIFKGIGVPNAKSFKRIQTKVEFSNARRSPPKRPGHGNAQQYVGANLTGTKNHANPPFTAHVDWRGGGAISKDFRNQNESNPNPLQATTFTPVLSGGECDSEAESMAAMFAAQDQQWQKTQETMATQYIDQKPLQYSAFLYTQYIL